MANIISRTAKKAIIAYLQGEQLQVCHTIGGMYPEGIAEIKQEDNKTVLTFKNDAIVVAEKVTEDLQTAEQVQFVRIDRHRNDLKPNVKMWPKLRFALEHAKKKKIEIPSGFQHVQVYGDEFAIPDYQRFGVSGWIITRDEITALMNGLPPIRESGILAKLWIVSVGFLNTPDEHSVRIVHKEPTEEDYPTYTDKASGQQVKHYPQAFCIEYDTESYKVKQITHIISGKNLPYVGYQYRPIRQYISVGRRLPTDAMPTDNEKTE